MDRNVTTSEMVSRNRIRLISIVSGCDGFESWLGYQLPSSISLHFTTFCLSQWHIWGYRFSGMWGPVTGWLLSSDWCPAFWNKYVVSKRRTLVIQRHCATSQKNGHSLYSFWNGMLYRNVWLVKTLVSLLRGREILSECRSISSWRHVVGVKVTLHTYSASKRRLRSAFERETF